MSLADPTPEEVAAFRKSIEEEVQEVVKKRGRPKKEGDLAPKETTNNSNPKRLFPLKNRYLKQIQSLNAKRKYDEAQALKQHHEARIQNAQSKLWLWEGKQIDRYNLMKILVEKVAGGELLSELCNGRPGTPSLPTVYAWMKEHPDFDKAMKMAKNVRAEVFADEALNTVRKESEPKAAALAKNKHDALMKRAALESPDFRERQAAPPEPDPPKNLSEMQAQLRELLRADPALMHTLMKDLGHDMPVLSVTLAPAPAAPLELAEQEPEYEDDEGFTLPGEGQ